MGKLFDDIRFEQIYEAALVRAEKRLYPLGVPPPNVPAYVNRACEYLQLRPETYSGLRNDFPHLVNYIVWLAVNRRKDEIKEPENRRTFNIADGLGVTPNSDEPKQTLSETMDCLSPDLVTPEQHCEMVLLVEEALSHMSVRQRTAYRLVFEGYTVSEIAERTKSTPPAVYKLLERGAEAARRAMTNSNSA